ncbi:TetR family transcriptional regulator [Bacillus sp. SA1-12]|uniref:TetR/AcrR family transcriptional regulator n=1 Tax=Bacillus sp. SA1-12 TaxID=1455638 RepID=UPI000626EE1F|nr:TetR/AcrR family transcriptional regulator [Bacillus sp. SA1-12]KKI90565.1 TetR family transcriptional regulator [Bacillus sp. SA1-12]
MSPRAGLDLNTILSAASEIVDTEGVDSLTLATLAKKLKIRPPSLYNHVEGLQGLQKALAHYGLEELYERMSQAAIGRSKDEAVHAISQAYISFARAHPGLYEATLWANADVNNTEFNSISTKIVDLVVRVLHAYELGDEESIHASRGLRSILHGFASLEQKNAFGIPLDIDISINLIIDTFIAGIHKMKSQINQSS